MIKSLIHLKIFLILPFIVVAQSSLPKNNQPLYLSQLLLEQLKKNDNWQATQLKIESISYSDLTKSINSDDKKFAFWINIYNAYIQIQLLNNSKLYENRSDFFSKKNIPIGQLQLSFDNIEHDILRKAEWKYGFGWIKNPFLEEKIEELQPSIMDNRIHFALNCGAKSCPKIAIYTNQNIKQQLEANSRIFIQESSRYDAKKKTIYISPIFSWFRGDFGNEDEVLKLLKRFGVISKTEGIRIDYQDYDWTLALNNYVN